MVTRYLHRNTEQSVHAALKDTRVVVVSGARQVGKSTLARRLLRSARNAVERSLDNATELAAARADPNRFVHHTSLMLIDEIQRAPELMLAIKSAVDTEPRPGQYLLTGSARLLGLRHLPDALVGRMETIEIWPLSQGEIEERREDFIDRVFDDDAEFARAGNETRAGYVERVTRGGFPEAVRRDEGRRARFFASYADDLIDRDVRQLAEIQRRDALKRLLIAAAGRSAQLLKTEALASDLRVPASTIERYLTLFEDVFLIKRVPAWSAATTQRAVQMRKLLFVDSGLNAHLIGRSARRLAKDDAALGPLLENFVISELARQLEWATTRCAIHHFRDRDGVEVDAVIEAADGRVAGFEVKAGETVRAEDFGGLRHLQRRVLDRFQLGVVFYTGKRSLSFGDRLKAVPIDALWTRN